MELYRQKFFFPEKVVVVDGITRTGKSMLGPILGSFEGVEIERIEPILEKIAQMYHFKKITKDAAIALLRIEIQMMLYDSMISRKINFRWWDHTSIFKNVNTLQYIRRMFMPEGDVVVRRIKQEKPVFQVQQHDVLGISDIYFESFGERLRILEMIRHPVDLVHDQFIRG